MSHVSKTTHRPPNPAPPARSARERDLRRIIEQHQERVRRVLRHRGVAERDLPDAQQEVFLVVHRKLAEFEGRSSLGTWLHRIAINVASEHRRRARHRYELLVDAPGTQAVGPDPHAALEARDGLERLGAALAALSDEQRDVFLLREVAGLSMHEVADQLDLPLKTAFSRLYAARRGIAAALGRRGIAVSTLWMWLLMWLAPRGSARAHTGGAASPWHLPAQAAQLPIVAVALVCSTLVSPQRPRIAAPMDAPRGAAAALHLPADTLPTTVVGTPGMAPAALSAARIPQPEARDESAHAQVLPRARTKGRARGAATSAWAAAVSPANAAAPAEPAVDSLVFEIETTTPAGPDDLIVTRAGAHNLRPRLAHPLAERIGPSKPLTRVLVRGRRDAPSSLTPNTAQARRP
jgi:RNA polymerase sigma-70 factor, ECF subfamily